jgi:serine/threonine protein phosphatase 1
VRTYAIGDIHGQRDALARAHARIDADRRATGDHAAPVVHLGDLVDRGPDSRGVLDTLIAGIAAGAPWVVLKGNHDRLFARFLDDPDAPDPGLRAGFAWLHPRIGGGATLASYGLHAPADRPLAPVHAEALRAVPAAHRAFLAACPDRFARGAAVFVHAGIRPGVPLDRQTEDDLLWIREPFLSDPRDHGALIVHGHTALDRATLYANRLNLDSGAGYGGPVSAAVIEGRSAFLLTDAGRVPLVPA